MSASDSQQIFEDRINCDGDCGAYIEIGGRDRKDLDVHAAAEALGWTTRDPKPKRKSSRQLAIVQEQEVYCPFCQRRAERIVNA